MSDCFPTPVVLGHPDDIDAPPLTISFLLAIFDVLARYRRRGPWGNSVVQKKMESLDALYEQ